jgi:tRNA threonylcarbamoyl adenosine modification protein YeaZ/ribosomal-protein-alanine acetyltransferase
MIVLALETVTRAGSVALLDGSVCRAARGDASRTHGERLPADLIEAAEASGHSLRDVDLFAIVLGPGSFTGVRVGVAAIQGLALVAGKGVVGLSTLDVLARGWMTEAAPPHRATVVACLDGQRGQVFYAAWTFRHPRDESPDRLIEASVGLPQEAAEAIRSLNDSARVIVGDGGARYASIFAPVAEIVDLHVPMAEVAAREAASHPERAVAPHALRPIYIRRPDAELARDRAGMTPPGGRMSGQEIVIARAEPDDLAGVAALQQRTFTNPWAVDALRWELEHTDVARLYVARAGGEVVGYCACWLIFDELHVNSLAVDPAWRRQGVARRIWRAVLADVVPQGARTATLEVRRSNDAARALYEALGFQVEGVRHDYYQHPREDALILWHRHLRP